MIQIVTDSTSDLSEQYRREHNITMLPLTIHFGSDSYRDTIDLDSKNFYSKLREAKELPTTSQVPPGEFEDVFHPMVEQGDEVIVINIASLLSATYSSAVTAAQNVAPDKIHVIDSNSGSFGTALLVKRAVKLRGEGKLSAKQIADELNELAPRVRIYAVLDSLKYLKMGGRLSGSAAFIGTLLGIKPMVEVKQGKVNAIARIRGEKNIIKTLMEHFQNAKPDLSYGVSFGNADAFDLMQDVIKRFEPILEGAETHESDLGAVIGTHTGPGVVGVGFIVGAASDL